ncbi:SMP-30/gluconolactonase/LRE family protein [Pontivivens insulae]|uniref:Gluconolactonase n=1 Tax=Pontivivens insulae TaxID=1639689 RepID=A0A2R8AF33_9RHOB|nr:SMP-30/gluconolactonase/LRE family protein [Pontivivens insulae]RED12098.1 sugar lactone lactonase YvrE [Pontivivens insulae]SPF30854.1 Gluconolactonase [Pontivivens insulae]
MYRFVRYTAFLILAFLAAVYLTFWPTGIAPVAWEASDDPGLTGMFEPNPDLAALDILVPGEEHGPEDLALGPNGDIWTTTAEGGLWRMAPDALELSYVGPLAGRPLGLEFGPDGALYIADSYLGLLRWTPDGGSEVLVDEIGGIPLRYANQIDVASDGTVYFSVSTWRHDPEALGGTLASSVIDLWEHRLTGSVWSWKDGEIAEVARGFSFANGIALTPDESALLLAETGGYRIWRIALGADGPGEPEVILDALPGFPDNIQAQGDGTFWVGIVSPRRAIADMLGPYPGLRNVIWRLPEAVRPKPVLHGILMRIDANGEVLDVMQDPDGGMHTVTGGLIVGERLFVSSLSSAGLGVMPRP